MLHIICEMLLKGECSIWSNSSTFQLLLFSNEEQTRCYQEYFAIVYAEVSFGKLRLVETCQWTITHMYVCLKKAFMCFVCEVRYLLPWDTVVVKRMYSGVVLMRNLFI